MAVLRSGAQMIEQLAETQTPNHPIPTVTELLLQAVMPLSRVLQYVHTYSSTIDSIWSSGTLHSLGSDQVLACICFPFPLAGSTVADHMGGW
jgi:hypothetical protein